MKTVAIAQEGPLPLYAQPVKPPHFTWEDAYGNTKSLDDYAGKVIFLNFWATWCGPCRIEMPAFNFLQNRYGLGGFEVIAINVGDETPEKIFAFLQEQKLDALPIHIDKTMRLTELFGAKTLPSTYVINRQGQVIAGHVGIASWMSPNMLFFIENLLKEEDPNARPFYSDKMVEDISQDFRPAVSF